MSQPTRTSLFVLTGLTVLLVAIVVPAALVLSAEQPAAPAAPSAPSATEKVEPEFNPAVAALLKFIDTAPESKLAATPGISPDALKKIMAHRASGAKLKTLSEFEEVSGVTHEDMWKVLKPFQDEEDERRHDAE